MKHAAVEKLVRTQFNIPTDSEVVVKCLACINDTYEFEVEWWDSNLVRYQSNFSLPHIEFQVDDRFVKSNIDTTLND